MIENIDYNNLNYLDITIITLIVILAIKGFVNGLIKELFGAIGLVGGVIVASQKYALASQYIHQKIFPLENEALLNLAGFVAIVIAFWIVASLLGIIIAYFANKNSKMGLIGRIMGMGMSTGKYFLLFSVVIVSLLNIALIKDAIEPRLDLNSSIVYPYIEEYGSMALNFKEMQVLNPENFKNSFKKSEMTSNASSDINSSESNESSVNTIIIKDK